MMIHPIIPSPAVSTHYFRLYNETLWIFGRAACVLRYAQHGVGVELELNCIIRLYQTVPREGRTHFTSGEYFY